MKKLRMWATPLTIGTFLIIGVTGVLMFFHADSGFNKLVHEWVGLLMIGAVVLHLVLNFRAFSIYFRKPVALTLIGAGVVVLGLSFIPTGQTQGPDGIRAAIMAMNNARIETLADLAGSETDTVLANLGAAGYSASADSTLNGLAGGDRGAQSAIMSVIFSK